MTKFLPALTTLIATAALTNAQESLCDTYHVPANHLGNIESCVFDPATNLTTITFNAPAILQWEKGFNIENNQSLRFAFPGIENAAVLNRDLSGNRSNIAGTLTSNGRIILINPAGEIVIGSTGLIDADGGFLASTLDTPDDEALLAGGDTGFQGNNLTGVENNGTIRSANGDITLIGGFTINGRTGRINAPRGSIHIGAGTRIRLAADGEPRITVLEGDGQHVITNGGNISAANTIDLSAYASEPIPPGNRNPAIANHGTIRTTSSTGRVFLRALPGSSQILNSSSGTIETTNLTTDGEFINEGATIIPDDGANPGAPTGTRQFPRLTSSTLTQTPNSDFRLSRLSFSHLNGLESKKTTKRPIKKATKKVQTTVATTTRGTTKKKPKKIVLRRGTFFGKKTK